MQHKIHGDWHIHLSDCICGIVLTFVIWTADERKAAEAAAALAAKGAKKK